MSIERFLANNDDEGLHTYKTYKNGLKSNEITSRFRFLFSEKKVLKTLIYLSHFVPILYLDYD